MKRQRGKKSNYPPPQYLFEAWYSAMESQKRGRYGERKRVRVKERERERFGWWRSFKEISEWCSRCVCSLRQVLYNVLGLIKSSVRLRRAEQEEADCRAQAAAERERKREGGLPSLDLILHVEVNGKEQALSSQFLPSLCVSRTNTHTHTHQCTNVLTCNFSRLC